MAARAHRIVSLLPSATEILCAVGAGDAIVGISHECDFPESIRDRPVLTSARIAGTTVGVSAGRPAPTVTSAELSALRPDVVVVKPCGFPIERTLAERDVLQRAIVAAVPGARVCVTDGNAYFNRPGPRLVESLEILAACVHPDAFADLRGAHGEVIVPSA